MDIQFKSVPFEIKAAEGDGSVGRGLGSVFFNIDAYNEIVDNEAFDQDLPDFLNDGFIGGINHLWDEPIGRPTAAKAVKDGLEVSWKLSPTAHGKDVMILLKDGVIKKLSIGFRTLGTKLLETFEEVQEYWDGKGYKPNAEDISRAQQGATVLTRIKLFEISPVVVPANSLAVITAVKAAREAAEKALKSAPVTAAVDEAPTEESSIINESPSTPREFEAFLRDAGLSRSKAREAVSLAKTLQWDAGSDEAETAEDGPDEEVPEVAAETPTEEAEPEATVVSEEVSPEVIVTPAKSEAPEITADDLPVINQFDPVAEEKQRLKRQIARRIAQRQAELEADLERSFTRIAGR